MNQWNQEHNLRIEVFFFSTGVDYSSIKIILTIVHTLNKPPTLNIRAVKSINRIQKKKFVYLLYVCVLIWGSRGLMVRELDL